MGMSKYAEEKTDAATSTLTETDQEKPQAVGGGTHAPFTGELRVSNEPFGARLLIFENGILVEVK